VNDIENALTPALAHNQDQDILSEIIRQSNHTTLLVDHHGQVRFANPAAEQLFGRPIPDLIGSELGFPLVFNQVTDIEILRSDGSIAFAELRVQPVHWQYEPALLVSLHDITSRKRTEQMLIETQRLLHSTLDALAARIAILDQHGQIIAVNETWERFARENGADLSRTGVHSNYLAVCDATHGADRMYALRAAYGIRSVLRRERKDFYMEYPFAQNGSSWFAMRISSFGSTESVRIVVAHEDITERKRGERIDAYRQRILELVARNQNLATICAEVLALLRYQYPDTVYATLVLSDQQIFDSPARQIDSESLALLRAWAQSEQQQNQAENYEYQGIVDRSHIPPSPEHTRLLETLRIKRCWMLTLRGRTTGTCGTICIGRQHDVMPSTRDQRFLDLVTQLLLITLEQQSYTHQLSHQANHDLLTGLPNRLLFEDRLHQALEQAHRDHHMVGVLFIDLDRFKEINDTLGHAIGDLLLIEVARRLEQHLRTVDTLARHGGDEFMVALSEVQQTDQVATIARRLHDSLRQPFLIDGHELFVSASIGASIFPGDGEDADTLQRNADLAMYRAKKRTRNGFEFYDSTMHSSALARMELEQDLRQAVQRGELQLHFQPQVNADGLIVGAEALLRWQHPRHGWIPPDRFIPLAEDTGLIVEIGDWCITTVIHQILSWRRNGIEPIRIAINVSPVQFVRSDFAETIHTLLQECAVEPSLIELEITESTLMENASSVEQQISTLHRDGNTLAIDDFGTGYSSLSRLSQLPIGVLKIDGSFVQQIDNANDDRQGQAIVQAIISMGNSLHMQVVAEGVETEAQRSFLARNGCKLFQGYFFSRPLPADDLTERLIHNRIIDPHNRRQ
jgi:diguanylate cyclase (GGDEF)-like protein/PAS domain S-box-containing protein